MDPNQAKSIESKILAQWKKIVKEPAQTIKKQDAVEIIKSLDGGKAVEEEDYNRIFIDDVTQ